MSPDALHLEQRTRSSLEHNQRQAQNISHELGSKLVCYFSVTLSLLELFVQGIFIHIYNKVMSPLQIGFYQFNLKAYGNVYITCFMFGILNMSGQIGNVKHGDIFIPCKFIAHSKIKVIKECD